MAGGCAMRALAIGIVVAVAWLLAPRLTVEAHDDATGVLIGGCAVPNGAGRVALDYRHSIYGRAGREEFEASPAGLALVRLSSPAEAVLEYYARPEPVRRVEGGFEIRVDDPPIPRLRLLASATGQRTLVCGDVRLPLFAREPSSRTPGPPSPRSRGPSRSSRRRSRTPPSGASSGSVGPGRRETAISARG